MIATIDAFFERHEGLTARYAVSMQDLRKLSTDVYEVNPPSKLFGHRMVAIRLPAPLGLWIHSPVALSEDLWAQLEALAPGEPRHLVIPSRTHDLYLKEWMERIPAETTYAPAALQKAHPDWAVGKTLTDDFKAPWSDVLPHQILHGAPRVSEVAFMHLPSRTLILVDSVFNHQTAGKPLLTKLILMLDGAARGISITRLFRLLIKDKRAFRAACAKVLAWEFERVLVGHGAVIEGPEVAELRAVLAAY